MEHITELRHLHPVKVYRYTIQPPCIGCRPISTGIRHRRHYGKLRPFDLIDDWQIIKYNPILCLIVFDYSYNAICFSVLKMPSSLKTSLRENSPIKLFRLHFLKKLPKPFIFQLIQLLFSRFFCHKSTTFLLPSKTPIGGLYYQYILFYLFDLLKKGDFSLPFPYQYSTTIFSSKNKKLSLLSTSQHLSQ